MISSSSVELKCHDRSVFLDIVDLQIMFDTLLGAAGANRCYGSLIDQAALEAADCFFRYLGLDADIDQAAQKLTEEYEKLEEEEREYQEGYEDRGLEDLEGWL